MLRRIRYASEALLNLFITNYTSKNIATGVIAPSMSDYLSLFMFCKRNELQGSGRDQPDTSTIQDNNARTLDLFPLEIANID